MPMEVVSKRPPASVKEERRVECVGAELEVVEVVKFGSEKQIREEDFVESSSSPNRKDPSTTIQEVSSTMARQTSSTDKSSRPSSSDLNKCSVAMSQEYKLESTKAEMGEVREENERLKTLLTRIVKDYQSLQMHFFDIVQQEQPTKPVETTTAVPCDVDESDQLVSLSLGMNASRHINKEEKTSTISKISADNEPMEEGLTLGLDCKFEGSSNGPNEPLSNLSTENSSEGAKEEEAGEPWPPSKILKKLRSSDEEVSQQTQVKKTRVSVRARCDAPTMHDGCQWRKYGQKIAKGNPCPRAYYRCTVAPACPVRKQVQRCADDMSILITTYEGTHNHPLPISATAMASTTAAAACMLMSGSSASGRPPIGSPATISAASTISSTTANPNLHAFNFSISDPNSRIRPFYLPNPTISSTPSYPTITLDLTSPPPTTSHAPSQFMTTRFSNSSGCFASTPPRYSSSSLNFSSSEPAASGAWNNNGYLTYGLTQPSNYNKTPVGSSLYQSYIQKISNNSNPASVPMMSTNQNNNLTDTIAKAITSDPSFQSALAAAITSYVGGGNSGGAQSGSGEHGASLQSMKWGDQQQQHGAAAAINGLCGPSLLSTRSSSGSGSSSQQQGNLMFLQPALPITVSSKSVSASSGENIS